VVGVTGLDLNTLDPGIRLTVRLLRALDFNTCDSGDGKSKVEAIAEGEALDVPHVFMRTDPERMRAEADRLATSLGSPPHGLPLPPGSVEATYSPLDGSALLVVYGIDDAALAAAEIDASWIEGLEKIREEERDADGEAPGQQVLYTSEGLVLAPSYRRGDQLP
jgi:hypothetical protein